jgi:hypothetical protein
MADLSDVETAVLACVTGCIYPNGTDAPSSIGPSCRLYRGWPMSASLNADLAAGKVNITISPDSQPGRTTTRYAPQWSGTSCACSVSANIMDCCVTFSGTVTSGIAIGLRIDSRAYSYRPLATDTLDIIAAVMAAQIQQDQIALASGATVTIPGATALAARTVSDSVSLQEIRRQERQIRVICWCSNPGLRDTASSVVDTGLAGQPFVVLEDGSSARITYEGTLVYDQSQNALLYRRDLLYMAEYPTMITGTMPGMLFGELGINANLSIV